MIKTGQLQIIAFSKNGKPQTELNAETAIFYDEPIRKELTQADIDAINQDIVAGDCRVDINDWGTYWHTESGCLACEICENWDGVIFIESSYDWQGYLVPNGCQVCGGDLTVGSGDQSCLDCGDGYSAP